MLVQFAIPIEERMNFQWPLKFKLNKILKIMGKNQIQCNEFLHFC